jgi:hypothetical protein
MCRGTAFHDHAYRQLSCSGSANTEDDVLCAGNDLVFVTLDKIFSEVARLFPGACKEY